MPWDWRHYAEKLRAERFNFSEAELKPYLQLEKIGLPQSIVMRHATPHFQHVFSGDGYSAGYYSYMWSEVLDADAFAAFTETGDAFNPAMAARLKSYIYAVGGSVDPEDAYKAFRGKLPSPEAMLEKKGLAA